MNFFRTPVVECAFAVDECKEADQSLENKCKQTGKLLNERFINDAFIVQAADRQNMERELEIAREQDWQNSKRGRQITYKKMMIQKFTDDPDLLRTFTNIIILQNNIFFSTYV